MFLLILGSIYFYVDGVPAVSNFVVNRLPKSIDKEVGNEVRNEILKYAPVDTAKTNSLSTFYSELHFDSNTKIYVVKANEFNAFALPDNSIFVFDKVLNDVTSYTQLAALLGHEYSHIKYRHGMKGIAQALSWEFLGELLTNDDNSDNFIKNSNMLLSLKNSRAFETQADLGGLQLLREQQIDQNGMSDLFKTMLNLPQENQKAIPTYLSTHPDTDERLGKVEKTIKENPSDNKIHRNLELIFNELKNK